MKSGTRPKSMCLNPSHIWVLRGPSYVQQPVACRQCWRCRANRVSDYVGRSLCEASTSDWVLPITLTYADKPERQNDLAHQIITPSHWSEFIQGLRDYHRSLAVKSGSNRLHRLRFLVVGEYGSLRGRAHFHAIIFGNGSQIEVPHQKNFHLPQWADADGTTRGHIYADKREDEAALRYVCKYLLKNEKDKYWFSISKRPSIGSEFFQMKAQAAVDAGVFPSNFIYLPPGGQSGRPYMVSGATRRDYLRAILKGSAQRIWKHSQLSQFVADAVTKVAKWEMLKAAELLPDSEFMQLFREELDRDRPPNRLSPEIIDIEAGLDVFGDLDWLRQEISLCQGAPVTDVIRDGLLKSLPPSDSHSLNLPERQRRAHKRAYSNYKAQPLPSRKRGVS